jgi:Family of unknown function (DUF5694)
MLKRFAILTCALASATQANARGTIDLTTLDRGMYGPRAQVLVLGTVHLGEHKDLKATALAPVLDKLAAFKPQIITIEAISGEQCDLAARHPSVYGSDYCPDADKAKSATGLDVPAAIATVNTMLKDWPVHPTAARRRHLAALFLAANDRASADVQWLQLPQAERRVGDGLDESLVAMLRKLETAANEDFQIAAPLAARLGLTRVYPVDDHTGDYLSVPDEKAFGEAVQKAWDSDKAELYASLQQEKKLSQAADALPLYRYVNQPETLTTLAKMNVATAMRSTSPEHYPQMWVAGWETRNLRMVANIRATFRERPGARVLAIVGASHKPWFDGWLGQMQGVDVVDVEKVVR